MLRVLWMLLQMLRIRGAIVESCVRFFGCSVPVALRGASVVAINLNPAVRVSKAKHCPSCADRSMVVPIPTAKIIQV